jgi:hypothetical protein
MSYPAFFQVFRRWLLFSKNGLPFDFTKPMWFRGLEFWIAAAAFVTALHGHHYLAALAPLAALVAFEASMLAINRHFGGAAVPMKYWWVPFVLPIVAPAAIGLGWIHKSVEWRGRAYALDAGARLA